MSEKMFYIHDKTRGFIGNSMVWWAQDHKGYTPDINKAHLFKESELPEYLKADDLVAYPATAVHGLVEYHITRKHELTAHND